MAIHPTAIVNPHAEIDPTVEIGPYCVIDAQVRIAAGCRLFHNVYVTGWTRVGEDCVIHPGAIVGHEPQDTKYKGEPTGCVIGRGVVLREYVTIHRATDPDSETVIGDECFILAGAHVAHNCALGKGVMLTNNVMLAGHVSIGDRATLGGAVGVHQFVRIGTLAMITGHARVFMDVVPYALVDADGRVAGINRVGLRRAGFSRETTQGVRDAYRILFDRRRTFEARRVAIAELPPSDGVALLRSFLDAPSRRGIAGPSRGEREVAAGTDSG